MSGKILQVIHRFLKKKASARGFEYFSEDLVSPVQDLMLEHGVLRRILLIYRHFIKTLSRGDTSNLPLLQRAAQMVNFFIENYHEKIEEMYLFPVFKKKGLEKSLIDELENEHELGRGMTQEILSQLSLSEPDIKWIISRLTKYVDFYEKHSAEEDTIIFPQFQDLISRPAYENLGKLMETSEDFLFGKDGVESMLLEVSSIEKELGLKDHG